MFFFFFNDTATTEIYTLSLHDALPISCPGYFSRAPGHYKTLLPVRRRPRPRSEEHTSELQSPCNLVCRLLLEKKKKNTSTPTLTNNLIRSTPLTATSVKPPFVYQSSYD